MMTFYITRFGTAVLVCTAVLFLISGCAGSGQKNVGDGIDHAAVDEAVFDPDLTRVAYDPTIIMKRAEGFFERKEFAEAVVEYEHFLDLHKVHRLTPYALYKMSLSYVNQIQTVDRDPEPVIKARKSLEKLLADFPGSRYESDARAIHKAVYELMAQQEVYVGRFYYRKGGYLASLHRLEEVVRKYPDAPDAMAKALYYLALTYRKIDDRDLAIEYTQKIVEEYPTFKHHEEMRLMLAELQGEMLPPQQQPTTTYAKRSKDWVESLRSMLMFTR
ncbi:MAG TPA: outer membrane protein assembly factor BamD [Nitrospirales bacterium]|nr:outer membrane protein assembly factor BamD [Nitrospirales bacterium]